MSYRHPHTLAEMRANQDSEWVRPTRRRLSNYWDDIPVNTQRTWKKYRRNKWKVKDHGRFV
jgi:hypothetical protein